MASELMVDWWPTLNVHQCLANISRKEFDDQRGFLACECYGAAWQTSWFGPKKETGDEVGH